MPAGKPRIKEIIDRYRFEFGRDLAELRIYVDSRQQLYHNLIFPKTVTEINGVLIETVNGGFLNLIDGNRIPLHRVIKISAGGKIIYERPYKGTMHL